MRRNEHNVPFSATTITHGKITTLDHEVRDYFVHTKEAKIA
jgi:hypothetical protein